MQCPSCNRDAGDGRFCRFCSKSLADGKSELAGVFPRFIATLLDVVVGWGILVSAFSVDAMTGYGGVLLIVLAVVAIGSIIWWFKVMGQGYTPGKKILGLRVVKTTGETACLGRIVLRDWLITNFISGLFLGLGYIWALFDRDRQAWHDKVASTVVVREYRGV